MRKGKRRGERKGERKGKGIEVRVGGEKKLMESVALETHFHTITISRVHTRVHTFIRA